MTTSARHERDAARESIPPPTYCVECGAITLVVRHLIATMFEALCESCGQTFVVSMRDSQVLR